MDASADRLLLVADPQRWRVLQELARSDRRVGELTELLGKPQNLVSYHVGQLRQAGLVTSRRSAADGRDIYYRVDLQRCAGLLAGAGAALHPGIRLVAQPPQELPARRRKPKVLFLCTGNSARSQIAEALLEERTAGAATARSAGSHPKVLHPHAVRVMAERGIDIAGRRTKHLDRFTGQRFDHVITLCDKVREICPAFPGQPATAHWSMADPSVGTGAYEGFVHTADEIEERIAFLVAQIAAEAAPRKGGTT